jgi:hypothetical protein
MDNYQNLVTRKRNEYGAKFDTSNLASKFIRYYESGQRVIVKMSYGEVERGYVGVTTGWKPVFLLVHRRSDYGSSTTLSDKDEIIGTVNKYL